MPSTYTTSGIELIATGEQSGAWGDTTNVNLQIVDRLTSRAGTITLSGTTHTLSVTDGTLSDGHYSVLVFAGTPSGTNTVTVSPNTIQRVYMVRNTTAQTVVLSQGSGSNVSVPAGLSKIVYVNGGGASAAVFDITNTLSGNITGNASTATALQTARTIGGVSFNGTANINLPGVNQVGNQNTTGSAATLTTARTLTIGNTGKTFNGSANVAWSLTEIGVNNATLTLATSGIATGSQTFTSNQSANATFTVNVPATNLGYTTAASTGTVTSSTGTNATLPAATTSLAGLLTGADKTKLDGIAAGAQVNVATNLGYTTASSTGTVTSSTGTNATLPAATTSLAGLLTGADKTKLNGIAAGAQVNVPTNLSATAGTTAGPTINSSTGTNVVIPSASATASGVVTTNTQTFAGAKTFSSTITGSVSGNAGTATTLQTARTINGTSFNGSANITTANWGTARTIWGQSINGSANITAPVRPAAGSLSAPAFSTSGDTNTGIFFPAADTVSIVEGGVEVIRVNSSGNVGVGTTTPAAKLDVGGTGAIKVPVGTEAQRPTPATGQFRFNSDVSKFEGYNGAAWGAVGGGATGGGSDEVFIENGQTVTTNYTIPADKNAMSTGPITINAGVTVTVSTGARYVVI